MGVGLGRLAVRRPAGVADADRAGERLGGELGLEVLELALGAPPLEPAVLERRDAGRIIAAVFEPLERIDDRPGDRPAAQDADNAAHRRYVPLCPNRAGQRLGRGSAGAQVTFDEGLCRGARATGANCAHRCLRLPNGGVGGCSGGPRAPEISAWNAARAAGPCVLPLGPDRLRRCALAHRSAVRLPTRRRSPRQLWQAPMTRRSPPSSRRSSATPRTSAPISTTRARPASTRRSAIAAINVRSAASPPRPWLLSRPTSRPCRGGSTQAAAAIRAAPRFGAFSPCPAQPNRARAPPPAV